MARSLLPNVFLLRCPRCREGSLFYTPFDFKTAYKMPSNCPVCNQKFEPEPGFYYGAMFISYIFTGFLYLAIVLSLVFLFNWSVEAAMLVVILIALIGHLYIFRLSRSVWIHMVVRYRPDTKGPV